MSKKKSIIETTIGLISAHGILGTSTASIAKFSGVATGTLFHHFPTKKDLIEDVYLYIQKQYTSNAQEVFVGDSDDINYQTIVSLQKSIDYWLDYPKHFDFTREVFNSKYYTYELNDKVEVLNNRMRNAIAKGCSKNVLRDTDPSFLLSMIFTTLLTTVRLILTTGDEKSKEKYRQEGFVFIWNAIKKEEALV